MLVSSYIVLQDLINYYQEHSLVHCFPAIDTKLKCPYYVILDSPRKQMKSPLVIPQSFSPSTVPTPSNRMGIPPVSIPCTCSIIVCFMFCTS